jgi:CRISPR-associated protein Cmr3
MTKAENKFKYLITLEPLGLLYGSAGAFLSPENLVGRSGAKFPPSAVTLAGLIAVAYGKDAPELKSLQIAGPFWAFSTNPQNFCVPTPLNCLAKLNAEPDPDQIKRGTIHETLTWKTNHWQPQTSGKYAKDTWIPLDQWDKPETVYASPWEFIPHLHPRLRLEERKVVDPEDGQGSLFLENAVQMHPDVCLVYLSNLNLTPGWYRFGGESHLIDLNCIPLTNSAKDLLEQPLGKSFALITPALWGSNRLSQRYPAAWEPEIQSILTDRPSPFRYRLGGEGKVKRLSRGRYAVPAGTVYVTTEDKPPWHEWKDELFPKEGPYLNAWGCGLALPLNRGAPNR